LVSHGLAVVTGVKVLERPAAGPLRKGDRVTERNGPACTGRKATGERRQSQQQRIKIVLAQRDRLIADIAALRARGGSSKFVDNAQQLLTRWWSRANWDGREELLRSADWLVRLEQRQSA
jgi:hypothetical protein